MNLVYMTSKPLDLTGSTTILQNIAFMKKKFTNEDKPAKPIPPIVTRIVGIREDMVQNFPYFQNLFRVS